MQCDAAVDGAQQAARCQRAPVAASAAQAYHVAEGQNGGSGPGVRGVVVLVRSVWVALPWAVGTAVEQMDGRWR